MEILSETYISRRKEKYLEIRYMQEDKEKSVKIKKQDEEYKIPSKTPTSIKKYIEKITHY